ncbi:MAG TPA: cytidine deaminase [Prolixibacteraceae bacterium]|nr:cytidine deaminase [Prolixibacteraceae bacterium]
MQKRVYQIVTEEFHSIAELPGTDQLLVFAAREAAEKAYAPYSKFNVGAAVLLANGEIIRGNNQENADFTDGICAERVALFFAHATYPGVAVKALAVTAKTGGKLISGPAQPCGSCRQVLIETESRFKQSIRLILDGAEKIMVLDGADSLLPFAFKPDSLG